MTVIIKRPGEKPEVTEIENALKAMQEIVGGYIEIVTLCYKNKNPRYRYIIVCNDDGIILNLPMNVFGVCGTFFICKDIGDEDLHGLESDELADLLFLLQVREATIRL